MKKVLIGTKLLKVKKEKIQDLKLLMAIIIHLKLKLKNLLATEIQAFVNWIQLDKKPISDSKNGLEIVRILEKAQEGLLT